MFASLQNSEITFHNLCSTSRQLPNWITFLASKRAEETFLETLIPNILWWALKLWEVSEDGTHRRNILSIAANLCKNRNKIIFIHRKSLSVPLKGLFRPKTLFVIVPLSEKGPGDYWWILEAV